MKVSRRKFLKGSAAAAAGLSAAALSGCSANSALLNFLWRKKDAEQPAGSEQPGPTPEPVPAYNANVLTGEKRADGAPDCRIVGVMVNNISNSARQNARPQRGLSAAKILIESKVEGGITRFCALYDDVSAIPEVGPIRSGRDQFLQLLMPWQGLFYHDGESIFCTQFIKNYQYWDYNIGGKSYFGTPTHPQVAHRDSRGGVVAYEHTEFTSGAEIQQAAAAAGIDLTRRYDSTFFPFADYRRNAVNSLKGCESASSVLVRHSEKYRTSFVYDRLRRVYKMRQYSAATKEITDTCDELNGQQLTFANLLVCFAGIAAYPGDSADVQSVDYAGGGEAYFFTNGRIKPCRWSKSAPDSRLTVYDPEDPDETVCFNMGKTYVAIVGNDEKEGFRYGSDAENGDAAAAGSLA